MIITLDSIEKEGLGFLKQKSKIFFYRGISAPEHSFSSSFNDDFAIKVWNPINNIVNRFLLNSLLNINYFGGFKFTYDISLPSISKEKIGNHQLLYINLYRVGQILYIVEEATHERLEKIAIKEVIIQLLSKYNYSSQPYKMYQGNYYSVLYKDTLNRIWEEQEITLDPESFYDFYPDGSWIQKLTETDNPTAKKIIDVDKLKKEKKFIKQENKINDLGKRKKNVDWTKVKLYSKKSAEDGRLKRIKIKKAFVKKGNVLSYLDENNFKWDEKDLIFENTALFYIKKKKE